MVLLEPMRSSRLKQLLPWAETADMAGAGAALAALQVYRAMVQAANQHPAQEAAGAPVEMGATGSSFYILMFQL